MIFLDQDYLEWKEIDALSAKATLTTEGESINGVFRFDKNGDFQSFESDRFYGSGPDATQHPRLIEATGYRNFDGYRIPYKSRAAWKLPEGDFCGWNWKSRNCSIINRKASY